MVRIPCPSAFNGYLLKIRFKQWGKLWTPANLNMRSPEQAQQVENLDYKLAKFIQVTPLPKPLKSKVISKRYGWKKRQAVHGKTGEDAPTAFLLECYNPSDKATTLTLTVRSMKGTAIIPYQHLFNVDAGFHRFRIPFAEFASSLDMNHPFNVELIPNGFEEELTLYFGLMEFVQEVATPLRGKGTIKGIVWDLDHTLWGGVLVEDGPAGISLKPGIKSLLEELDRRGILLSIASKNHHDEAIAALKNFGLVELFLYPQISWSPKSQAIETIARKLNIGVDSLLFIDDQEFERKEVEAVCSGIRTMDAAEYRKLLESKACNVPVTPESMNRRKMYQVEQERQETQSSFRDDYKAFLRHCNINLAVSSLDENNLERVHELTQRTNQMNFSGNRYDRDVLRRLIESTFLDTYVLTCNDRFGSYGIVGFGIVDSREPRLTDLMFSCRIQSKRVEHAFLAAIIDRYQKDSCRDFHANYRKTPRNAPSGKVFEDIGMIPLGITDGVTSYTFPHGRELPNDGIIQVSMPEQRVTVSEA